MPILQQSEVDLKPIEDTFISEKMEVAVKEGDTIDTVKIVNYVTKEVVAFDGSIGTIKNDITNLEKEKAGLQKMIDDIDSQIQEKLDLIAKYQPEVENKLTGK